MHQVLGNLLSNALKCGKRDSTVQVVLTGIGEEVIFTVTNDGMKIGDGALRAFFDPLSRGRHPQTHRDQDGGLGLGPYICRQIALAHAELSRPARTRTRPSSKYACPGK